MTIHGELKHPPEWAAVRAGARHSVVIPFLRLEWTLEWIAYVLDRWSFLKVLERLGSFSVLIAVIFYFSDAGNRIKQRHYQAWQVINTAQGKGGNGGRIEAMQELNADGVPLVGVDVSSAFLQGLRLRNANLLRSNFSAADLRGSELSNADFTLANLHSTNLRGSNLEHARFVQADLGNADLHGSDLAGAILAGTVLDDADLSSDDLRGIDWKNVKSMRGANLDGVRNAPDGFVAWALAHGATQDSPAGN
jgi:hypothetical protein